MLGYMLYYQCDGQHSYFSSTLLEFSVWRDECDFLYVFGVIILSFGSLLDFWEFQFRVHLSRKITISDSNRFSNDQSGRI